MTGGPDGSTTPLELLDELLEELLELLDELLELLEELLEPLDELELLLLELLLEVDPLPDPLELPPQATKVVVRTTAALA